MQEQLQKVLGEHGQSPADLIPILQHVQEEFGYLPQETMDGIAAHARVPKSRVYAVATFYTMFRFEPLGKNHVCVCRGTACHVRGADLILDHVQRHLGIDEGQTTEDGEFSLETVACIGCCALAPVMTVNHEVHGRLKPKLVTRKLKKYATVDKEDE